MTRAFYKRHLLLLVSTVSLLLFFQLSEAATFTTPNYKITILRNCEDGVVGCDDISYEGVNRKTKKSIFLKGRDVMHYCPANQGEKPIPCHHEGYEFYNGKTRYYVSDEGFLEIITGSKYILYEKGIWDWGY
jgi:hypothetical protein